jgi:hypothetical protein
MSEQRFWFEEVPEDQQYWFLAPFGMSPLLKAEREAKRQDSGLTEQDAAELQNIESDMRHASVFGGTEHEAAEKRKEIDEFSERLKAVGYGDRALEVPWWPDVLSWEHEEGPDKVRAPILYTKRELAEEKARHLEDEEVEGYLQIVEQYGQADTDEAWDNYLPYRALWVDRNMLLDKLEDSTFLCVMVDSRLRLRRDFIEELRTDEEDA